MSKKNLKRNSSFTLIELIVTVALFLLVITLSIPRFGYFRERELSSEVDKLATLFTYLSYKAVAANQKLKLSFDISLNRYNYSQPGNNNITISLSKNIRFGFLAATTGPPAKPYTLVKKAATFKNEEVIFYPTGTSSS